jgi:hypothetical protein
LIGVAIAIAVGVGLSTEEEPIPTAIATATPIHFAGSCPVSASHNLNRIVTVLAE